MKRSPMKRKSRKKPSAYAVWLRDYVERTGGRCQCGCGRAASDPAHGEKGGVYGGGGSKKASDLSLVYLSRHCHGLEHGANNMSAVRFWALAALGSDYEDFVSWVYVGADYRKSIVIRNLMAYIEDRAEA